MERLCERELGEVLVGPVERLPANLQCEVPRVVQLAQKRQRSRELERNDHERTPVAPLRGLLSERCEDRFEACPPELLRRVGKACVDLLRRKRALLFDDRRAMRRLLTLWAPFLALLVPVAVGWIVENVLSNATEVIVEAGATFDLNGNDEQFGALSGDGDVVLLYSGYSDEYYKPLPKGRRFIADPVAGKTPAWPGPHPDCMEYMVKKNVMHVVTDGPSIGPMPDLGEPTHVAGLKYGAIFTEGAIGLHQLPPTGAFYCCVGPRHAMSPCSEARAFAILDEELAGFLISATRKKRVTDLSVVLAADLPLTWPGSRVGSHRQPYYAINILYASAIDVYQHTHMLDSNSGTHLIPPAFALPSDAFDDENYAPDVKAWLGEYVKKYGPRETSDLTTEKIPLSQTMGWARVIDVTGLIGTTSKDSWPASPEITVAHIQKYEQQHGALRPNEIVLFRTSHVDRTYSRKSKTCMDEPLSGEAEGWPAPGPDAIRYLSQRGIRCVGTDAPSLGSVDPKSRLFTYWALTSQTMVGVEFLTNLANVPERAYFVFAPIKIKDCHGGPGRAVVYY